MSGCLAKGSVQGSRSTASVECVLLEWLERRSDDAVVQSNAAEDIQHGLREKEI